MSNSLSFFAIGKRSKSLRKDVQHRRRVILELLESNLPLSVREISNKSGVIYSVIYEMIGNFVKAGYVKKIMVAQYGGRTDYKYELTNEGIAVALAISVDDNRVLGNRRITLLQKIFQPQRGGDVVQFFVSNVMLNAINRGLDKYVLKYLRNGIRFGETSRELNIWKIAEGTTELLPSEIKGLNNCVLQALNNLSDSEKGVVIQYYRNKIISTLFDLAVSSQNKKLEELASLSQKDPDGIYIPLGCKCGYVNERWYVKMEDAISQVFGAGLECPSCCKNIVPDFKTQGKDVRNFKIKTHS